MKNKRKPGLTFGDFITAAYQVCGTHQAAKMVCLAIHTRLVVLRVHPRSLIPLAEGKTP